MATLQDYISQCRLLLHDANGNFWSNSDLIGYINDARERVVGDTGCYRLIQNAQIPIAPPGGTTPTPWTASTTETAGTSVFSNIFTYNVTQTGTSGTTAPPYPGTAPNVNPPSTPFADGTAMLQYAQNAEIIPFSSLAQGTSTLDVLNINLYWGNSRVPLRYLPWTQFNAQLRYWQNYIGRPVVFSVYGQSTIYVGPVPDQSYAIELDTVVTPPALANLTDSDAGIINDPYSGAVRYYAAHEAKFKEQSFGESELFKKQYDNEILSIQTRTMTRRMPSPFAWR